MVLKYNPATEENTQVTWCCSPGVGYRCSIAVTGVGGLRGPHPQNRWTSSSDDTSSCSKEDEEDEGDVDVGGFEINTSPPSTSDEGSVCMSPVDASTKLVTPVGRLKTVISAPVKTNRDSMGDFSTTEGVVQNTRSVAQESKQIHTRPIYISEGRRSQTPPHTIWPCVKTDCNRSTSLAENESLFREREIPLLMRTHNETDCWLSSATSHVKIRKHLPTGYVTAARLAEDGISIETGGSSVRKGACFITEHEFRTPATSPTRSSEDNTTDSFRADSTFNEGSPYKEEDDVEQNTFSCITEKTVLRTEVQSPSVSVKDVTQEWPTVKTAGDNSVSGNEADCTQTPRRDRNELGMKPTVTDRNSPRDTSTPVNVHEVDTSILLESTPSKVTCGMQNYQESSVIKCPETGDKHSLCRRQSSPVLCPIIRNRNKISGKQIFEEASTSTRMSYSDEHKTQMVGDPSLEDMGESPHESSHLENHIKIEGKHSLVDELVEPYEGSPVETHFPRKRSLVAKPIKVGDQRRFEDGGFPQHTSSMGSHMQIREKQGPKNINSDVGRSSLSETYIQSSETHCLKNQIVGKERISPFENETHITDQQSLQVRGTSPVNKLTQSDAQQHSDDHIISLQRGTVLVQSRDLRPGGGETFVQQVDTTSGTGVQGCPLFSVEDTALRCRVLVLLWVLLGERRLREVGYPVQPVHRILWRAVDVCCSVAGVKSAAAVPLNADHDCGLDMLCFRDHTHRFLEVCAPTRDHWKQFGWASLTVDAVVRKIYDEGEC
jgi:hypothetical protein